MQPNDYIKNTVLKLESNNFEAIRERFQDPQTIRLLHAAIGINTEAGEVIDLLKKRAFYGKEVDRFKFIDELGDVMWYLGLACDALGTSFEEVMTRNSAKLATRYATGTFDAKAAINPNKSKEMEALQKATS